MTKIKEMWNEMKEKRFDKRIKKLKKQAFHYIQENENLERHIAELQGNNTVVKRETTKKNDGEVKKRKKGNKPVKKPNNKKIIQKQSKSDLDSKQDFENETKESEENKKLERLIEPLLENKSELSKQQDDSINAEISLAFIDFRDNSTIKETKVCTNDETGNDPKEKIIYDVRPDRLGPEDMQPSITMGKNAKTKVCYKCGLNGHIAHNCKTGKINTKQKNKIAKRCNFCRKRGHIKRNCPSRQRCWKWMEERSV